MPTPLDNHPSVSVANVLGNDITFACSFKANSDDTYSYQTKWYNGPNEVGEPVISKDASPGSDIKLTFTLGGNIGLGVRPLYV